MTRFLLGRSPLTTITGLLVAILTSISQSAAAGTHHWQDFLLPAAMALFGRLAGDDGHNNRNTPPPFPMPVPNRPYTPPMVGHDRFQRRGREYRQRRTQNGQFAPVAAAA